MADVIIMINNVLSKRGYVTISATNTFYLHDVSVDTASAGSSIQSKPLRDGVMRPTTRETSIFITRLSWEVITSWEYLMNVGVPQHPM